MLVPKRPLVLALLSLALSAGCAVPGHVRAVKTANRLEEFRASVEDLQNKVDATAAALTGLVARKDTDAGTAFQQLEASVHALESAQRRADSRLVAVREEAEQYFFQWKEQAATINDEDLKEQSEERRVELSAAVASVSESMTPPREAIDAYLTTFRDTLKYLSIDLTPSGIASIESRGKEATKTAKSIHSKLADVLESVREAEPQFARARASAPKAKPVVQDRPSD